MNRATAMLAAAVDNKVFQFRLTAEKCCELRKEVVIIRDGITYNLTANSPDCRDITRREGSLLRVGSVKRRR